MVTSPYREHRCRHVVQVGRQAKNEFVQYFSEWRNFKSLLGCALCWFLVDITFYGINLNQSSILNAIGFTKGSTWGKLMKTATGNLIITSAGFLPGYFITMFTIDIVGRKPIQLLGFTMNALFLGILAGRFNTLKNQTGPFFVVFVFLQLFFNFGANATTSLSPPRPSPPVFVLPLTVFALLPASAVPFCHRSCSRTSPTRPRSVTRVSSGSSSVSPSRYDRHRPSCPRDQGVRC